MSRTRTRTSTSSTSTTSTTTTSPPTMGERMRLFMSPPIVVERGRCIDSVIMSGQYISAMINTDKVDDVDVTVVELGDGRRVKLIVMPDEFEVELDG